MEDYRLNQTGQEVQDILNGAAMQTELTAETEARQQADELLMSNIEVINGKIPAEASAENPLTDKQYVDDSIASASATFRGTYNEVTDLELTNTATHAQISYALSLAIDTADNNDYCFVQIPTSDATPTEIGSIERYKFVTGTGWEYEYTLNNSGFTAEQWASINSGITSGLVTKLTDLPTNAELNTLLNGKANAADVYTKSETYNKTELDSMITTPDVQYVSVTATAQTTSVTDVLPATGAADTVYRVGSWDGTQYSADSYSEYAWNGSAYVLLNVKNTGIATGSDFDNPTASQRELLTTVGAVLDGCDAVPTAGSVRLVKSGGVFNTINDNLSTTAPSEKKNYSILEDGNFGRNKKYYHAAIKVNPGEQYVIVNEQTEQSTVSYTTYAFATTDAVSAGSPIPLVDGYTVEVAPLRSSVIVTIPEGCSYLLVNYDSTDPIHYIYNVKRYFGRISNIEEKIQNLETIDSVFDRTDFISENIKIGDLGIHAYVSPDSGHTITESDNYRYFWVKCLEGDVINTITKGWTDNVSIGFSPTRDFTNFTVLVANNGTSKRTGTAPSDGYFFVGLIFIENGTQIDNYVWMENNYQEEIDKLKELNKIEEISITPEYSYGSGYIQAIGTTESIVSVVSSVGVFSYIFKVKAGESITATVRQYSDTSAIAFSEVLPEVGVNVKIYDVGTRNVAPKTVTCIAPSDGYIMLSYLKSYSDGCENIKAGLYTITKLEEEVDVLSENQNNFPIDFRNNIYFSAVSMQDGTTMENWTGNDVIENIYEPLRLAHPEYITRKSLGKDQTNTYDIWLYEFNNSADELFDINHKTSFTSNIILPSESGLTAKQCAIKKSTFDEFFEGKNYNGIYFLVSFAVRKLEKWTSKVEQTINGEVYYVFTFETDVKVTTVTEQSALEVWWTVPVRTYDQHAVIISGIHADEISGYIGTALSLKYLVEHHADNPSLDYIYNHVKLSVIPIVNIWGANQSPKSRTDYSGNEVNNWVAPLSVEQSIVASYIDSVKEELSFFADFHTSELWINYGFVYAIPIPHIKIYPAVVATANYLCKHWFPELPPYNWNIGGTGIGVGSYVSATKYMYKTYNVAGSTVEFCGSDLMSFGNCAKWSAQYMTYCVENYLNFMLALCSTRIKNNSKEIISDNSFERTVMS